MVGQGFSPDTEQPRSGEPSGLEVSASESCPEPQAASATSQEAPAVPQPGPVADDERVAITPTLWLDPDVRWLTGVHEAEGHLYLVRELYEELLWWLLMPSLLRLAGESAPSRAAVEDLSKTVEEALATAEATGYRIDTLLGSMSAPDVEEAEAPSPDESAHTIEQGTAQPVESKKEEPERSSEGK